MCCYVALSNELFSNILVTDAEWYPKSACLAGMLDSMHEQTSVTSISQTDHNEPFNEYLQR